MTSAPRFDNWKAAWEWHAEQARRAFGKQSETELLSQIAAGMYDPFYAIWYALAEVGTLRRSAPVLLDVLRREAGEPRMLVRYHCAAALFLLMGTPATHSTRLRERVQWDQEGEPARQAAIQRLERRIDQRLKAEDGHAPESRNVD